jgi:predicted PurR-regulated permease PerM
MSEPLPPDPPSPDWQPGTRLVVGVLLILVAALLLYQLRQFLIPLTLAMLLAYILHPLVVRLERRLHSPRWVAVGSIYLVLLVALAGTTTGIGLAASQALTNLASYLGDLSQRIPAQLEALAGMQIRLGPWTLDLGGANLTPAVQSLTSALSPLLSQTGSLIGGVAGATATALGTTLLVLVVGFYLLLDFENLGEYLLRMIPPGYRSDARRLMDEASQVWDAFLRGQLLMGLAVGAATGVILAILGVRFALGLGLVAGVLEFVPVFGPWITGLISVLVALFQASNFWGLNPLAFALAVAAASILIQQVENNILYPRIIGHSLNLNPLVVLLALLAAGSLAGLVGLLLAAPTVATLRLIFSYLYWKVVGVSAAVPPVTLGPVDRRPSLLRRGRAVLRRLRSRRPKEPG